VNDGSAPAGGAEVDKLLRPALEFALTVAREGARASPPVEAPPALRPVLHFQRLPAPALRAARAALADDSFRERVATACSEESVGRVGWLYLVRPEGWLEEFILTVQRATEQALDRRTSDLDEQVRRLRADLDSAAEQRDSALRALASARAELVEVESSVEGLRVEVERLGAEVARLGAERSRAVGELKRTESRLADRTTELRSLREAIAARPEPAVPADPVPSAPARAAEPPDEELRAIATAARVALGDLTRLLERLTEDRGTGPDAGTGAPAALGAAREPRSSRPARRRVQRRPGGGLIEGTVEYLEALLAMGSLLVMIDGYNLTMLAWPSLTAAEQRDALERAAGALTARTGADCVVVYDGVDGEPRSATTRHAGVQVVFTPGDREADDEILDRLDLLGERRQVAVVSNDRRVQIGAEERGAHVVTSSLMAQLILRRS